MRQFRTSTDGVSIVVGTLLLIVIVIALGVAVGVMVNQVRKETGLGKETPDLAFELDSHAPTAKVVRASPDLDWVRDLRLAGTCTPTLNGAPFPTLEGRIVTADDLLACNTGETLTISSSDAKGNALLFNHSF
ncbi:MAG: archaellin/type IV pilin N-terminal domain-containing protein [Thermoplasmatota archaeon]